MLNVFLLEDDTVLQERYAAAIHKCICINNYDMKLAMSTGNSDDIIKYIRTNEAIGLYFLDVRIGGDAVGGFKLGKEIKKYDPRGFIVIITAYTLDNPATVFNYKLEPLDYIIKNPNINETIHSIYENMATAYERYTTKARGRHTAYPVDDGDIVIPVEYNDIYYFIVSGNRKITLHAKNKRLEFKGQLKHILDHFRTERNFVRCDRGIIVNCDHITEYQKKARILRMRNEDSVTASLRGIRHIEEFFRLRRDL